MRTIAEVLASPIRDDNDWWQSLKIKAVEVTVYTTTDDKDSEETVHLTVKYGPFEFVRHEGSGQRWPDQDTRPFMFNLPEPHPPASASFSLHVRKDPAGSEHGKGWHAQFRMTAITEGGARMTLGGISQNFEIGDGHPFDFWAIQNAHAG